MRGCGACLTLPVVWRAAGVDVGRGAPSDSPILQTSRANDGHDDNYATLTPLRKISSLRGDHDLQINIMSPGQEINEP
jgi:hypothetical protein